jgi:hypothetical protein
MRILNKILFISLLMLLSCEEEVVVMGDYPSKPIVYCILNPGDSIHYLRISKSFVIREDPERIVIDSDSLIFKEEFYAYLEEEKPDRSGQVEFFYPSQFTQRDSGLFPGKGLATLSANMKVRPGMPYGLYINIPGLPRVLSGSIDVIVPVKVLDPDPLPGRRTTILPDQGYTLRWSSSSKYSVYQVSMNLNYLEGDAEFNTSKSLELPWPLIYVNNDSPIISYYINPASFYKKLIRDLSAPPQGMKRKIIGFDIEISSGGEELSLASQMSDNYYESFYGLNDYSNVDGAIGVFSSFSLDGSYNNLFSDFTIDYLATSDSTSHLGFLKHDEDF